MDVGSREFQPFATRTFLYTRPDGSTSPILVEIGIPYAMPADDPAIEPAWACPFRTRGFAADESATIFGVDGVQALHLALGFAGTRVAAKPEAAGLDWADVPNFGFPPMESPPTDPGGG